MDIWSHIARHIGEVTGTPFTPAGERPVGGGCINAANVLADGERRYFVKRNDADKEDMFAAEAEGLRELAKAGAVRVPEPVCWGACDGQAYLVMEYLELGSAGGRTQAELGRRLAAQHRVTRASFGWFRDNTIGATPQPNPPTEDWIEFYRRQRLGYQLSLAAERGAPRRLIEQGETLAAHLEALLAGHRPEPSLLHGDLWSGNYSALADGEPVIFDPAVYYGDREADIAMTELFGGFGRDFYSAYNDAWPLDPGYRVRKTLYNLYHILNHFNLFGGGYASQAEAMTGRLLAEIR